MAEAPQNKQVGQETTGQIVPDSVVNANYHEESLPSPSKPPPVPSRPPPGPVPLYPALDGDTPEAPPYPINFVREPTPPPRKKRSSATSTPNVTPPPRRKRRPSDAPTPEPSPPPRRKHSLKREPTPPPRRRRGSAASSRAGGLPRDPTPPPRKRRPSAPVSREPTPPPRRRRGSASGSVVSTTREPTPPPRKRRGSASGSVASTTREPTPPPRRRRSSASAPQTPEVTPPTRRKQQQQRPSGDPPKPPTGSPPTRRKIVPDKEALINQGSSPPPSYKPNYAGTSLRETQPTPPFPTDPLFFECDTPAYLSLNTTEDTSLPLHVDCNQQQPDSTVPKDDELWMRVEKLMRGSEKLSPGYSLGSSPSPGAGEPIMAGVPYVYFPVHPPGSYPPPYPEGSSQPFAPGYPPSPPGTLPPGQFPIIFTAVPMSPSEAGSPTSASPYPQQSPHVVTVAPSTQKSLTSTTYPHPHPNPQIEKLRKRNFVYMVLAALSFLICFNFICGALGLLFAILAEHDYGKGKIDRGKQKSNTALGLTLVGVIIFIIVMIVLFAVLW